MKKILLIFMIIFSAILVTSCAKDESSKLTANFEAEIYLYTFEEGGRKTNIIANYRPQFNFSGTEVMGVISMPDDETEISLGQKVKTKIELIDSLNLKKGEEFNIFEGSKKVGYGKITKLY